ncbi:MAG: hypothetical protein KC729_09190, partial [Candidatus Eisenbacteria bacterium]|nr:hypothetical protein [Candidatus Eisenbacteria bacterium]
MNRSILVGSLSALALGVAATALATDVQLVGSSGNPNNHPPVDRVELLFRGDLTPELGIGCSNGSGTSGGPNDVAVGVTATVTPPFPLTQVYYNIFTNVSPNITQLDFVAWRGGAVPGAELGRQSIAPNWGQGDHTVSINSVWVPSAQFYFGFNQNQTNVGLRWGLDTSSGSWGTSFIRAPTCGAATFTLLDNLGFPGNWVMAASVDVVGSP